MIIELSWLTTRSNFSMSSMLDVFMALKFEMMSSMNTFSWLLFGARESFEVRMISSKIGMTIERGAWSDDS